VKNPDPRIDQYILHAQEFAIPILTHLRKLVHKVCPDCQETMKWSFPHFEYKGEILCSMAAFKKHCAFGFWKEKLMIESRDLLTDKGKTAMGDFGKITSLRDLPSTKILTFCIQEAMRLNDDGIKIAKTIKRIDPKAIVISPALQKALNKNANAKKVFESLSPSHKKEYIEYIDKAKREETKLNRIEKSIAKLTEGKAHNHKYESKK
jgi:uncharacterized protein YdeI (YjbR/CyaY-like superfamily)